MLLYLSGKIRDETPEKIEANVRAAGKVAYQLWKMGHAVHCPHYNTKWHHELNADITHEEYMRGDLQIIARFDGMVMLQNWLDSEGAMEEHEYAKSLGMPIYYDPDLPPPHPTECHSPIQAKAFAEVLGQIYRTHLSKNQDYSASNVKLTGEIGVVTRLWDKMARLLNLSGFRFECSVGQYTAPKNPAHESIDDTYLDLSCYAIIGLLLRRGQWGH
jgi:hypothetical protein